MRAWNVFCSEKTKSAHNVDTVETRLTTLETRALARTNAQNNTRSHARDTYAPYRVPYMYVCVYVCVCMCSRCGVTLATKRLESIDATTRWARRGSTRQRTYTRTHRKLDCVDWAMRTAYAFFMVLACMHGASEWEFTCRAVSVPTHDLCASVTRTPPHACPKWARRFLRVFVWACERLRWSCLLGELTIRVLYTLYISFTIYLYSNVYVCIHIQYVHRFCVDVYINKYRKYTTLLHRNSITIVRSCRNICDLHSCSCWNVYAYCLNDATQCDANGALFSMQYNMQLLAFVFRAEMAGWVRTCLRGIQHGCPMMRIAVPIHAS